MPDDPKSGVLLRGRYQSSDDPCHILVPVTVMDELLATILTVQSYVVAAFLVVGFSTLATAVLVFLLSLRLRSREIQTLVKIGGSRPRIAFLLASEVVLVLVLSLVLGTVLTILTREFGSEAIRGVFLFRDQIEMARTVTAFARTECKQPQRTQRRIV